MKKLTLIFFIFISLSLIAQSNLTKNELALIKLSLEKSYELKNAVKELMMDSIDTKIIKQNFIPTLALNGVYAYGASNIKADIPTLTLPFSGINVFEGNTEFDVKGNFFNSNLTAKALLFSGMQVTYGSKAFIYLLLLTLLGFILLFIRYQYLRFKVIKSLGEQ